MSPLLPSFRLRERRFRVENKTRGIKTFNYQPSQISGHRPSIGGLEKYGSEVTVLVFLMELHVICIVAFEKLCNLYFIFVYQLLLYSVNRTTNDMKAENEIESFTFVICYCNRVCLPLKKSIFKATISFVRPPDFN